MDQRMPVSSRDDFVRDFTVGGRVDELGGKGYRLAGLYRAGFPVPNGFVLTAKAFEVSLASSGVSDATVLVGQKPDASLVIPDDVFGVLRTAYRDFFGCERVIVRSSGVAEDTAQASFAGLFRSVSDVDEAGLRAAVADVLSSAVSPEVADYARRHHLAATGLRMAVVVQRQIEPWISGVCFTAHPVTGEQQYIVEFVPGRSLDLVSGKQSPRWIVFDSALELIEQADSPHVVDVPVSVLYRVAEISEKIATFFGEPQDIEWAIDHNESLFVLQSRPITVAKQTERQAVHEGQLIAQGVPVSTGIASGPTRRVLSDLTGAETDRLLQPGDIAVGHALFLEHLPALAKCAGVISVESSMLSHVAIRARELGIPCVGGITNALTLVPDGQLVTIDGTRGGVYGGSVDEPTDTIGLVSTGFDPDRMEILDTPAGRIIYQNINNDIVIFLRKPLDPTVRADSVHAIETALNISPSQIKVDEHLAWEGVRAPSIVYMQQETFESIGHNLKFADQLIQAQEITRDLDARALRNLVDKADSEAKTLFSKAVKEIETFKLGKDRASATQAARLFDEAKRMAVDFVGISIIDVLGESAIRHRAEKFSATYGISLINIFTQNSDPNRPKIDTSLPPSSEEDKKELSQLALYAYTLGELKNRRPEVLSVGNYTGMDIIRDLIAHNLEDLVEQYDW
ncbi:MAG: PEP/pyruvate-binding domain-containing protein [Pseudonocardiaceae bacterium]